MDSGIQRRLVLSCIAVAGLVATVAADRHYRAGLERQNQQALTGAVERLAASLRLPAQALRDLGAFLSAAGEPFDEQAFQHLGAALHASSPWLRGIAYADAAGVRYGYVASGEDETRARQLLHAAAVARDEGGQALLAVQGAATVPAGVLLLTARRPLDRAQGSAPAVVGVVDVTRLLEAGPAGLGKGTPLQLRDPAGTVVWGAPGPEGVGQRVVLAPLAGGWTLGLSEQMAAVRPSGLVLLGIWGVGAGLLFSLLVIARRAPGHAAKPLPAAAGQVGENHGRAAHGEPRHPVAGHRLAGAQAGEYPSQDGVGEPADRGAELEALTYSVSHDLRAPLRAMQGFAGALVEDCGEQLGPLGRDYAQRIVAAGRRMERLIEDLLVYSRISRQDIPLRSVDLERVIRDVVEHDLTAELRECSAQVKVDGPLPSVIGHHRTLVNVVRNLLSNAIKFVQPGVQPRVRLWAECLRLGTAQPAVRLWVEDNGIGIAPAQREQIFKVFERLHGIENYPGSGIGLAIVYRGVERMCGRAGVESALGRGSRFWIELAMADGFAQAQTPEPTKEQECG